MSMNILICWRSVVVIADHDGQPVSGAAVVSVLTAEFTERPAETATQPPSEHSSHTPPASHRKLHPQHHPALSCQPITDSHKWNCQLGMFFFCCTQFALGWYGHFCKNSNMSLSPNSTAVRPALQPISHPHLLCPIRASHPAAHHK